jgi:hypothetical protein
MLKLIPSATFCLATTLVASSVLAQQAVPLNNGVLVDASSTPAYLTDSFSLSLGTFVVASNVKATLDGSAAGSTAPVDFNHTFGSGSDHQRIRADALWRMTPTQHLRFVYFDNNVTRTRNLDQDFAWGNLTFQTNASASFESKLAVYELSYEYAFVRRPNFEFAAGAGIHMLDMSLKLSGNATVTDSNGTVTPASFESKTSNLPAPLPVIGARASWAVTPTIFIEPEAQWFKFKYDAYDGSWWDLRVAAKWMFSRHFGVGLGYDYFRVNVDVSKANFNGNLNLGYSGLQVMLVGSY